MREFRLQSSVHVTIIKVILNFIHSKSCEVQVGVIKLLETLSWKNLSFNKNSHGSAMLV